MEHVEFNNKEYIELKFIKHTLYLTTEEIRQALVNPSHELCNRLYKLGLERGKSFSRAKRMQDQMKAKYEQKWAREQGFKRDWLN